MVNSRGICCFLFALGGCHAFVTRSSSATRTGSSGSVVAPTTFLRDSLEDHDASSPTNNDTLVTREMFQRELLADPVVKRKKGKRTEYKVLDNRDSLPFRVENQVPDPYTKKELKQKQAKKVRKHPNTIEEGLKSSLYVQDETNKDDGRTMIGEYFLDKHTTTGDVLEIGDVQYKVVRHKCQYKYAGGKRFVMVRKILQVKEISRLQTEEYLKRQLQQSSNDEGAAYL